MADQSVVLHIRDKKTKRPNEKWISYLEEKLNKFEEYKHGTGKYKEQNNENNRSQNKRRRTQ